MFIIENVCKSNVLSSFSRRTFIKTASAIHQFPTILFSKIGTQFGSHTERNLAERKCRHSLYSTERNGTDISFVGENITTGTAGNSNY